MRYLFCIAVIVTALAVPAYHADAAAGNPCSLLSLGEAQSVTHLSLTSPKDNPLRADLGADKDTGCTYSNDQNQAVDVSWHDDTAFFPGNARAKNTEGFKRVSGIGEHAWSSANAMAVKIDILKNGKYVSVGVANPDGLKDRGAQNYAQAIQLAKLVADRL